MVATAQTRGLQQVVEELEQVLQFMRVGCSTAFATCFESQGWPAIQTDAMLEAWSVPQPVVESRVTTLVRQIAQVYRDAYYALQQTQHESVVREVARVEIERDLAKQQASWAAERMQLLAQLETARAEKVAVDIRLSEEQSARSLVHQELDAVTAERGLL